MRLLTTEGYKTFEELCNTKPMIIDIENNHSQSKVWCSGEKETIRLTFSNGKEMTCTPNHVFMTIEGEEVEAKNLKNKKVALNDMLYRPINNEMVMLGFIQGDGELTSLNDKTNHKITVNIGKKDSEILELFKEYKWSKNNRAIYVSGIKERMLELGFEPLQSFLRVFPKGYKQLSINDKASFLQGCYTANGSVVKGHRISYKTTSREFANQLKETLKKDFDIHSIITVNKPKVTEFDNGSYLCKQSYDICINRIEDIVKFAENINFYYDYKSSSLSDLIIEKTPYVRSIKDNGVQKVYDFTEPIFHWGFVEGRIVHNCAEEPLPAGGSCLLGALNLAEFVRPNGTFNQEDFAKAVRVAVRGLNEVLDEGLELHPLEEQRKTVYKWRQIGLGIMGFADMLMKMKVRYGSERSIEVIHMVGKILNEEGLKESSRIAQEKGSFYKFDADKIINSTFFRNCGLSANSIEKGLRNSQLFTIAPTGSISTMLQVSGGVEPIFSPYYTRTTKSLEGKDVTYTVETPIVKEVGGVEQEFVTWAGKLDPFERVKVQGAWQQHIDASISSTVNLANDATVEQVANLYIYAWEKGCKGLTIFRDGCARTAILNNVNSSSDVKEVKQEVTIQEEDTDIENCIARGTKIQTGCGTLWITAYFNKQGRLCHIFLDKGSQGGCMSFMNGLSRMISMAGRKGATIEEIVDQLNSVVACPSYAVAKALKGNIISSGKSCPSAIGKALIELAKDLPTAERKETKQEVKDDKVKCPQCGGNYRMEGGCGVCTDCGFSRCS